MAVDAAYHLVLIHVTIVIGVEIPARRPVAESGLDADAQGTELPLLPTGDPEY